MKKSQTQWLARCRSSPYRKKLLQRSAKFLNWRFSPESPWLTSRGPSKCHHSSSQTSARCQNSDKSLRTLLCRRSTPSALQISKSEKVRILFTRSVALTSTKPGKLPRRSYHKRKPAKKARNRGTKIRLLAAFPVRSNFCRPWRISSRSGTWLIVRASTKSSQG